MDIKTQIFAGIKKVSILLEEDSEHELQIGQ